MSQIEPNPVGQVEVNNFTGNINPFLSGLDNIFKYSGTPTDKFLSVLSQTKTFAQNINDILPKLIAELNKYPTS